MSWYDWTKTLSYDASITMVVGGRGIGKTYGLRKQFVSDFVKNNERFVEICRYQSEVPDVAAGYFNKFEELQEFPQYLFKTDGKSAYIADKVSEDEKPDWEQCGYFVALTSQQRLKKQTFSKVRRCLLDEAILDRHDRYHRYIPHEFETLANVMSTLLRERPDEETRGRLYLLGNSCSLVNPYFEALGIEKAPDYGYSWHNDKSCLLHYVEPVQAAERRNNTLVGRMLSGNTESEQMYDNKFTESESEFVEPKSSTAKFSYAISYQNFIFAIWEDLRAGLVYVTGNVPKNSKRVYYVTKADASIDYQAIRKTEPLVKILVSLYFSGYLRYDTPIRRERFFDLLSFLGVS